MDSPHTSHSSVVGIPSKTAWSTTAAWHFGDGELFAAVSFWGSEQAPHDGRHLVSALSQDREANSPAEIYQQLKSLVSNIEEGTQFSGAFLWVSGAAVFVLSFGHARIALQRAGSWRWLVSGDMPEQVLQGKQQPGDLYALLTFSGESLSALTQSVVTDDEMAITLLMPMVQRLENQAEVAAQMVHIEGGADNTPDLAGSSISRLKPLIVEEPIEPEEQSSPGEDIPEPSPVSFSGSQDATHLISPAKLSQGIEAAHVVRPKRGRVPKWWRFLRWERRESLPRVKLLRVVAVVILVGVVLSTVVGVRAWRLRSEYQEVIEPLLAATQEVSAYPEDQRFAQRDAARSLLERLQATKVSFQTNQREVERLKGQVQLLYEQTAAETNLVTLPIFFDFRLVESGFLATKASTDREVAVFIDPSQSRALQMDLGTKRTERIDAAAAASAQDVALSGTQVYWTSQANVTRTTLAGTEPTVIHTWPENRDPKLIERFGTNLYVMDTAAQQLWRLDSQSTASPSAWIRAARGVDLSSITSLTIDGEIWLGSREGDVYRLALGERQDFAITGLQDPLSSTVQLATSVDGTTLAIVEPAMQRVVFVNKQTGEYLRQVSSPQIGAVTDVFWGVGEKQLYLVAGSVVYRVE
jgi:hypothetical protein